PSSLCRPHGFGRGDEIPVLPNGVLLAIFARLELYEDSRVTQKLLVSRSSNKGLTWTVLLRVATQPIESFFDPETGLPLSNEDMVIHSAAVAPDGSVYIAWDHPSSATSGEIDVATSRDGGLTWSGPTPLAGVTAFAFERALAV